MCVCVCGSTPQVCPRPFSTRGPPASPRGPQGSLSRGLRKKENLHLHNFVGVGLSRPGSTGPPKGSTRIVHEQSFHRQYFVRPNVSRPGSTGPPPAPKGSTRPVMEVHEARAGGPQRKPFVFVYDQAFGPTRRRSISGVHGCR